MHCVLLADLAALVSQHGPAILYRHDSISSEALTRYWTSSRGRFDLWHQTMARYKRAQVSSNWVALRHWWSEHVVVLEEVLVSEMLTRVIASLAAGLDDAAEKDEISPITHAVYLTHLEARNRVQQLMLDGRGCSVPDAVRLNRLRKGVEAWTDAMIGRMSVSDPRLVRYSIDPSRATAHAREMRAYGHTAGRDTAVWLANAAMHETLVHRTSAKTALPHANRTVADSVMLMLRPDLFDSVGSLKSLWLHRMQIDSARTDRVLDELLAPDLSDATTATGVEVTHNNTFARWYS